MPNTEVKLSDADDSQLATARENMSLPGTTPKRETAWVFSICAGYGTAARKSREREGLGADREVPRRETVIRRSHEREGLGAEP